MVINKGEVDVGPAFLTNGALFDVGKRGIVDSGGHRIANDGIGNVFMAFMAESLYLDRLPAERYSIASAAL